MENKWRLIENTKSQMDIIQFKLSACNSLELNWLNGLIFVQTYASEFYCYVYVLFVCGIKVYFSLILFIRLVGFWCILWQNGNLFRRVICGTMI
jgi:hypothetical protein